MARQLATFQELKRLSLAARGVHVDELRADAEQLDRAGFPLAVTFDVMAPRYEADGATLRGVEEILKLHAICQTCDKYDGRKCILCLGCSGQGDRKYLREIVTVGGKCLLPVPLW